jgi:pimeloyl-ACP methyl ester carboxylesterase
MPVGTVNGTRLFYETVGDGPPLLMIHGSWGDHHNWDAVAPQLAESFRVTRYDRRGHSRSVAPPEQGTVHDDANDAAGLIETVADEPAFVVGNSFGTIVALHLACTRPELVRRLVGHEPPLVRLLDADPPATALSAGFWERANAVIAKLDAGDWDGGAKQFVEDIAMGPGMWEQLPGDLRRLFVDQGPTWLGEMRDPDALSIDLALLQRFDRPTLLSQGTTSPPMFSAIIDRLAGTLPNASRHTFTGAGHVPHLSHPADYVNTVRAFMR